MSVNDVYIFVYNRLHDDEENAYVITRILTTHSFGDYMIHDTIQGHTRTIK